MAFFRFFPGVCDLNDHHLKRTQIPMRSSLLPKEEKTLKQGDKPAEGSSRHCQGNRSREHACGSCGVNSNFLNLSDHSGAQEAGWSQRTLVRVPVLIV